MVCRAARKRVSTVGQEFNEVDTRLKEIGTCLQPGGFSAISRGLSAATPPVQKPFEPFHPSGVAANLATTPLGSIPHKSFDRGRRFAQPPANGCQASGLKTECQFQTNPSRSAFPKHIQTTTLLALFLIGSITSSLSGCGTAPNPDALTPRELKSDARKLSLVRFSPDGSFLAAGGADGEVIVWSDLSLSPQNLDSGHHAPLVSLTWAPNNLLTTSDLNNGFVGWQFGKSEPKRIELPGLPAPVVCVAFRPKVTPLEFVIGSRDGSLIFFDQKEAKQLKPDHRGAVKQIAYLPDGRSLISAGADGKLIWREANSRRIVEAVKAHETEISRLVISRDGKQFTTGDWNGRINVWDVETRKSLRTFEQPDAVSGLGWAQGHVVSASWDGSLRLWNVASGQLLRTISTGQPIHDLAVNPRTEQLATVCLDRSVHLWELPK